LYAKKALGSKSTGPLVAIAHLKKITSHVILAATCDDAGGSDGSDGSDGGGGGAERCFDRNPVAVDWARTVAVDGGAGKGGLRVCVGIPAALLVQGSHKLAVLVALVRDLARRGHKVEAQKRARGWRKAPLSRR
jgi:hypothetical protein